MLEEVDYCEKTKNEHFNQPMDLTNKDEENFQAATKCHICKKGFSEEDKRVRDHCHVTGKYRGRHIMNVIEISDLLIRYL